MLIGSAEHTLGSMHMNKILKERFADTLCRIFYRIQKEAGAPGKDTNGILRQLN